MPLNWFDAREAAAVGAALADHFQPGSGSLASGQKKADAPRDWRQDLPRLRQRIAREAGSLKLNLFKRAKLLNSFKWRLAELGFDPKSIDELTQVLLMQLVMKGERAGVPGDNRTVMEVGAVSARRLPTLLGEADALFAQHRYGESAKRLEEALTLDGRRADVHAKLGAALCCVGRYGDAESALRRAIGLKPSLAAAYFSLGTLLRDKGEFAASETALRRAVKQDPRNALALASLGLTLGMRGRLTEAREYFEKALRLKPHDAGILSSFGWLAGIEGRFEEAEGHHRAALEADSRHPGARAMLAGLRRMTDADKDWLEGAERTLADGVPPLEESKLRYAMGKYFDDLGKYSKAFEQYRRANELQKLVAAPYDRTDRTKLVDDMITTYTRQRLDQPARGASESARPVFVTGMMRSGTSLVEQIIASHPQAMGAGELDFWHVTARKHESLRREDPDEPLTRKLGESYLKVLQQHSPNALRVVDKSTFNTDHLGLIHRVLPQARIIYVQRDPIDNCLSCFFQDFVNVASFTMDLSDLAHYYQEHHRLISHWQAVLPETTLLVVPYAELVADPETWSRRMIQFSGLEWDSRCLQFHKTQRSVLTASNWQVRQPVYSRSVGRWRNYEKFIRPLAELRKLEPA
ncbi:MAG TPA: sulfotransferase [Steroidobacteraceae bacterium]|jgi:tetratricopeptide (TPR) repeat protein|nr:sulfotransferase [Steroidobacteraceae bacterium]